jgi:hypothetical protein
MTLVKERPGEVAERGPESRPSDNDLPFNEEGLKRSQSGRSSLVAHREDEVGEKGGVRGLRAEGAGGEVTGVEEEAEASTVTGSPTTVLGGDTGRRERPKFFIGNLRCRLFLSISA